MSPSDLLAEGPSPLEPAAVSEAGELFLYTVKEPVYLGARKSALLPIIDDGISSEAVTVIKSSGEAALAMRLTNSTPLTLEGGTVSIFTEGTYAGESRLDRLKPREVRIIEHGEDLDVEVVSQLQAEEGPVQAVRIRSGSGQIEFHRLNRRTHKLNITWRSAKARMLLLELATEGYRVTRGAEEDVRSPGQPRYARLAVNPRAQESVDVVEEGAMVERMSIDGLTSARLSGLLQQPLAEKVKAVLLALNAEVLRGEQARARRTKIDTRVSELEADVKRVRENLAATGKSNAQAVTEALGRRLLALDEELTALRAERVVQETTIEAARRAALALPAARM